MGSTKSKEKKRVEQKAKVLKAKLASLDEQIHLQSEMYSDVSLANGPAVYEQHIKPLEDKRARVEQKVALIEKQREAQRQAQTKPKEDGY